MSEMYQRLAHSSWDCKYHVVFVPKQRHQVLFGQARRKLGEVFHALARQKECVTPETVIRWHRAGFRLYWKLTSRVRTRVGRKPTPKEVRELIFRMVVENPT